METNRPQMLRCKRRTHMKEVMMATPPAQMAATASTKWTRSSVGVVRGGVAGARSGAPTGGWSLRAANVVKGFILTALDCEA